MNKAVFLTLFLVLALNIYSQQKVNYDLPALNVVKEITLSPSYSCRSDEDFKKGYAETALFVSGFSRKMNSPDLLFNGACNALDYFHASTAGNDMALIADLGENINLEAITEESAFVQPNSSKTDPYTRFSQMATVQKNHTYVVLLNKSILRGLIIFSVLDHEPNKKVTLKYAVRMYEIYRDRTIAAN